MPQAVNDIIALVALGAHPALTKNCGATIQRLSPQVRFSFKKLSLDSLVFSEGHTLSPVVPGIFNRSFYWFFDCWVKSPKCRPLLKRWVRSRFLSMAPNNLLTMLSYRSRRSSPRWLGLKKTRTPRIIWVRAHRRLFTDDVFWQYTGQLKAKLAKLKRELLTPTGGGGGGGCEYSRPEHSARC